MKIKDGESLLQYKKRVIDPISKSFCAAKWYNATIWLGSGITTSCHHPLGHKVSENDVKENYKMLHNTPHKKECRSQMLKGERPAECEYCWKVEDIKRDNISDRVFKTAIYEEEDINKILQHKVDDDVNLKTLEISFDRTCNFACSYCSPSFSTTWVNDIRDNGAYAGLDTDKRQHYTSTHPGAQLYKPTDVNPYIEAFWKWWPELSKSLFELRVTGGEPLLSPEVWRLLDFLESNPNENLALALNSNLGAKDELIHKLISKSRSVKSIEIYTSNESFGAHAEYIRDGLSWDRWSANVRHVMDSGHFRQLHIMMTINSLCLFSITEFMDWVIELKKKFRADMPFLSVNILRYPTFQSPLVLPDELRNERKIHIEGWLKEKRKLNLLQEMELESIQRLIDYLDVVRTPHSDSSSREELEKDFKRFFEQYDLRRGKSFIKAFADSPSLLKWYNSIELSQ